MPSPATFEDRSPLDWSWKLADIARGDAATAHAAVTAAVMAFRPWADLGPGGAGRAPAPPRRPHRGAHRGDRHRRDGRHGDAPRVDARPARRPRAPRTSGSTPTSPLRHEERVWSSKGTRNTVVRMPAGPAVVITPWNAPFMLSTWKLAPALAAGNPVVLKPAEWSPLSCSLLADLTVEAGLPPGVFNLVQGIGEEVGPPLVARPPGQADQLHRLPGDGPPHRPGGGGEHRPVHRRARRQGPADRVRRRRPRRRRGEGRRAVRRLRPGLPRRHPPARRGVDPRRVPVPLRRRPSPATCSATAATRRRRSPR